MKPMTETIFEHLKRHGSITPMVALREYGCFRLAARIGELREDGHRVESVIKTVERRGEKVRFAEYFFYSGRPAAERAGRHR